MFPNGASAVFCPLLHFLLFMSFLKLLFLPLSELGVEMGVGILGCPVITETLPGPTRKEALAVGEGRVKVYYQAVGRVKLLALRATKPSCLEGRLAGAMGRFPESLV